MMPISSNKIVGLVTKRCPTSTSFENPASRNTSFFWHTMDKEESASRQGARNNVRTSNLSAAAATAKTTGRAHAERITQREQPEKNGPGQIGGSQQADKKESALATSPTSAAPVVHVG